MKKYYLWIVLLFLISGFSGVDVVAQAQFQVKGKVLSMEGPLPGVSIQVKGTTTGTSTDVNGEYTLQLSDPNSVLIFSFVGYLDEEVSVNGRTALDDVMMVEDISTLSEIIV